MGFVVTLLAASVAAAGNIGNNFRDYGMAHGLIVVRTLRELKLTDAQQTRMLNTFAKYKNEIQKLQDNMYET